MTVQRRNAELVDILRPDFQARYEPNFAWEHAVSAFLHIPGLRGFWPFTSLDSSGNVYDVTGQGRTLTIHSMSYSTTDLITHGNFVAASSRYLSRADEAGLDILGTESFISTGYRGLTLGGWFWHTAIGSQEGYLTKWNAGTANRSYLLYKQNTDIPRFSVSLDGTAVNESPVASTVTLAASSWYFVVGRFNPSTEVAIFVNGTKTTSVAAIVASCFNGNAAFEIGSINAGSFLGGRGTLCFLSGMYVSDAIINSVFQQTRAMFGV